MKNLIGNIIKKNLPKLYEELIFRKQGRYCYTYNAAKYPDSFLDKNKNTFENNAESKITETIFCFWTGENEMSDNRKKGLKSLEEKTMMKVTLITPENLEQYILPDYPLHKGYELLSLVHRSDYLRCYFMHHYGGGYADIKTFHHSWKKAFQKIKSSKKDKFIIGYQEVGGVAQVGGKLYDDLKFYYRLLIGNGAYICKSNTCFTKEWYNELHNRMDVLYPKLIEHSKRNADYPVPYTYLLGQIFHPLCLKYHRNLIQDNNLKPDFTNYH